MKIINHTYKWNGSLAKRSRTDYIITHHLAGTSASPEQIHNMHVNDNGWVGIGYNFYVRKDGSIHQGRPIDVSGAHTTNYNSKSVGICFEGNFENEIMSDAQKNAGKELISYLKGIYPNAKVKKHQDFAATACPGKNFPFDEISKGVIINAPKKEIVSANDIIWELKNGPLKVEINEVDKAVEYLEKAKEEESSLYWILYKLVNR